MKELRDAMKISSRDAPIKREFNHDSSGLLELSFSSKVGIVGICFTL